MSGQSVRTPRTDCPETAAADTLSLYRECPSACPPPQSVRRDGGRAPICPGCLQRFDPVRPGQRHCRPSCIALEAERKRRPGHLFDGRDEARP